MTTSIVDKPTAKVNILYIDTRFTGCSSLGRNNNELNNTQMLRGGATYLHEGRSKVGVGNEVGSND